MNARVLFIRLLVVSFSLPAFQRPCRSFVRREETKLFREKFVAAYVYYICVRAMFLVADWNELIVKYLGGKG